LRGKRSRDPFSEKLEEFNRRGEELLAAGGGVIDEVLRSELKVPGTDRRCGVNLACRPPNDVATAVRFVQKILSQFEPDQYYYPPSDLHLTLVEICHSRSLEETSNLADSIRTKLRDVVASLPAPRLMSPMLGFDARACAVNFFPADGTLRSVRQSIREQLVKLRVAIDSRYEPQSAHLTIMRYIAPLHTEPRRWVKMLREVKLASDITWSLSSVWLTWGANWYGMRSRISEYGPCSLLPANEPLVRRRNSDIEGST